MTTMAEHRDYVEQTVVMDSRAAAAVAKAEMTLSRADLTAAAGACGDAAAMHQRAANTAMDMGVGQDVFLRHYDAQRAWGDAQTRMRRTLPRRK